MSGLFKYAQVLYMSLWGWESVDGDCIKYVWLEKNVIGIVLYRVKR